MESVESSLSDSFSSSASDPSRRETRSNNESDVCGECDKSFLPSLGESSSSCAEPVDASENRLYTDSELEILESRSALY